MTPSRSDQYSQNQFQDGLETMRPQAILDDRIDKSSDHKVDHKIDHKILFQEAQNLGQPKKKILVFDFSNNSLISDTSLGEKAAYFLKKELSLTGKVLIFSESFLTYKTADFVDGDAIKVAQLVGEARKLGASFLVIGRIRDIVFRQQGDEIGFFRKKYFSSTLILEAKLFDAVSGREISSSVQLGEASDSSLVSFNFKNKTEGEFRESLVQIALEQAVSKIVPDLIQGVKKINWQGRVVGQEGIKIFVNAGRASGLMVGDILRVLTVGHDIYDSQTEAYLGHVKGELKGTIEVVDFIGMDAAVTKLHSGNNVLEGDIVELY
jgi:curli biogenesis system outer membrane secretion channel CsgG